MDLCYDDAVRIGFDTYKTLGYSTAPRYIFKNAADEFKEFMQSTNLSYSAEHARQWVNSHKCDWDNQKSVSYARSLAVLDDIIAHGRVTSSLQAREDRIRYESLSGWCKAAMDSYLATLPFGASCMKRITQHCSRFFRYLDKHGSISTSDITGDLVGSFLKNDSHKSNHIAGECCRDIARCLQNMAYAGLILEVEWRAIKDIIAPDPPNMRPLPDIERVRFEHLCVGDFDASMRAFDSACRQLMSQLKGAGYAKTPEECCKQAIRELRQFMAINRLPYSYSLSLEWLDSNKKAWSHAKYLSFRRTVICIDRINSGFPQPLSRLIPMKGVGKPPEWCASLLSDYEDERQSEGCAKSTIGMIHNSCLRILHYMDKQGIDWANLSPAVIKEFHACDEHATPQGRSAYACRIRGFLQYLARKGLVADTLYLSIPSISAPRSRIIKTLSAKQIDAIHAFRAAADTPDRLRASAIIMLGLSMGLRGCDIAGLRMADLLWNESSISLIQRKTGKPLKLPLTIEAGNSLWLYINEGRPKQAATDYIFVCHRAPFCVITRDTFGRILDDVIAAAGEGGAQGFHILRRTYASRLLSAGNTADMIASALGHSGTDTVNRYLSTDEEGMRMCAVGMDGIEYTGGMGI